MNRLRRRYLFGRLYGPGHVATRTWLPSPRVSRCPDLRIGGTEVTVGNSEGRHIFVGPRVARPSTAVISSVRMPRWYISLRQKYQRDTSSTHHARARCNSVAACWDASIPVGGHRGCGLLARLGKMCRSFFLRRYVETRCECYRCVYWQLEDSQTVLSAWKRVSSSALNLSHSPRQRNTSHSRLVDFRSQ